MNLAHYHLLLNHWPIIGTFIALGMLVVSVAGKSDDLKQASYVLFALIALLAIPTYTSGNAAEAVLRGKPGVSQDLIALHEGSALLTLLFLEITGGLAWIGLWKFRSASRPANWPLPAVLLCAIVTVGLVTVTGNTGGDIRHPEILSGEEPSSIIGTIGVQLFMAIQYVVTGSSRRVWPILEDLHFLGLTLLLGTIGILNLRILGFLKSLPLAPLHRFVPWAVAGLATNLITGMLFFLGMPYFYIFNADFQIKMLLVVIAGANLLLIYSTAAFRDCERLGPGDDAPGLAKFFAASSVFLWVAIIVAGRYMPFFEESLTP